jgi:hypothetical protein
MIETLIQKTIDCPSEENVKELLKFTEEVSYSLLEDAETLPYKSREYFSKRQEAFFTKANMYKRFINCWVAKHHSTENFPLPYKTSPYEMTLNIPFQEIKK